MNCLYCNNLCSLHGTLDIPTTGKPLIDFWKCSRCPHHIIFEQWHKSKDIYSTKIYVSINNTEYCYQILYRWESDQKIYEKDIAQIYSTFRGADGQQYLDKAPIISLSSIPNVTPQNVKEKVKLYLTFI